MTAYLCLGSNLAGPAKQISKACEMIDAETGVQILRKSALIETEPYGITDQPMFFNQVLEIETLLKPHNLLSRMLQIETN
ncbi:MAG: 2-amino-4-hydroxy-6-hydroxymethyldihydropteridine diphosphokinase, partial [Candidatus Cloacimonadaceae bacterium]|nr:2-amino-4-hydroxy-6-hydroxymethyldihydropteridine diphosphokinase [Candidatus Cloacimonadaceae bacterium]